MTYLARANVALSVTMTACSTLASPVMTPLMMKLLAGQYVPVNFWGMMLEICNMILVPLLAGLVANHVLYSRHPRWRRGAVLGGLGVLSLAAATAVGWLGADYLGGIRGGLVVGFLMFGVVVLARLVVDVLLHGPENWMDRALPVVSMAGICLIIGIITARLAEDLRVVGLGWSPRPCSITGWVICSAIGAPDSAGFRNATVARSRSKSACKMEAWPPPWP